MVKYSRKRFQEALRACKDVAKNSRLPATQRLRAAELIYLLYGGELPGGTSKRDRKTIKELVSERAADKDIRTQVESTPESQQEQAEREMSRMLEEFLGRSKKPSPSPSQAALPQPQPEPTDEVWKANLEIAGDPDAPTHERRDAIRHIQNRMPHDPRLQGKSTDALLQNVRTAWEGAQRPAKSLGDLWGEVPSPDN